MSDEYKLDLAIIGGGILGLNMAYRIHLKNPQLEIAVFDKEKYLGDHTSGRNSGVLHAGIYYPQNSLKHRYCLDGIEEWYKLVKDLQIPFQRCGKFIVSQEADSSPLEAVYNQAKKNNVLDIRSASKTEIEAINQFVFAASALYSPNTGIIDQSEAITILQNDLFKKNIPILLGQKVENLKIQNSDFHFKVNNEDIIASSLINCAGLWSIDIRKNLNLTELDNYFVKGNYLKTSQKLNYKNLFYPIPPKDLKGLGVHSTIDMNGDVKFGPNTQEVVNNSIDYQVQENLVESMWPAINELFKNVQKEKLYADYCGIRPKIKLNGELYTDFWIKTPNDTKIKNYFECCGIESPGFTAAPAIAKKFAEFF